MHRNAHTHTHTHTYTHTDTHILFLLFLLVLFSVGSSSKRAQRASERSELSARSDTHGTRPHLTSKRAVSRFVGRSVHTFLFLIIIYCNFFNFHVLVLVLRSLPYRTSRSMIARFNLCVVNAVCKRQLLISCDASGHPAAC